MATTDDLTVAHRLAPVGRFSLDDVRSVATEARRIGELDKQLGRSSPPGGVLLLACLVNPNGAPWRMTPSDLRVEERAELGRVAARCYVSGREAVEALR